MYEETLPSGEKLTDVINSINVNKSHDLHDVIIIIVLVFLH